VKPLKALFICRGSVRDGLGHVIRSRRVAQVMQSVATVRFIVIGDESAENLLVNHNLDFTITADDQHALFHYEHFAPDVVLFDLMDFDRSAVEEIARRCVTVTLSPIFASMARMDLVFHRTAVRGDDWPQGKTPSAFHCGLDYTVISDHCRRITPAAYRDALDHETLAVGISMGGGDAANKTLSVLEKLKDAPDRMLFWVLLGEGYAHSYQDLVQCVRGSRHEIILARTNDSMWRILNTCAFVVLAGGTTTYEAAYAGLPSVNTLETPDHFFLIRELVEKGACAYAGYTFEESLRTLRGIVTRLNRNRAELLAMHERCQGLVDGQGANRIVEQIQRFIADRPR
jgi:spore coat polysaccharide biosynthesis predicted glycosyltransferase SpsG